MVELDEQFPIVDFNGSEIGQLSVSLLPCNPSGKEILGEYVENPNEMVHLNSFCYMLLGGKESGVQGQNHECHGTTSTS